MDLTISFSNNSDVSTRTVELPHSKSILNRLLILGIYHELNVDDVLLDSEDLRTLQNAIGQMRDPDTSGGVIDIKDSGSACRFMIPALAFRKGHWTLKGTERMHERPVKELIDVLRSTGCTIKYLQNDGYLPLSISGIEAPTKLAAAFPDTISSQYITSLLLSASLFDEGVEIRFSSDQVSATYIYMTLSLLQRLGYEVEKQDEDRSIYIHVRCPSTPPSTTQGLEEPDWSAASFFFLLKGAGYPGKILLAGLKSDSIQGDARAMTIFQQLGVESEFISDGLLIHNRLDGPAEMDLDLSDQPDLVIPVVLLCAMRNIGLKVSGVEHLRHKESDRIDALNKNLEQIGYALKGAQGKYSLKKIGEWNDSVAVDSYNDHRIAMAFAALSLQRPVSIQRAEVVSKSFPEYWNKLGTLGFNLQEH